MHRRRRHQASELIWMRTPATGIIIRASLAPPMHAGSAVSAFIRMRDLVGPERFGSPHIASPHRRFRPVPARIAIQRSLLQA